jgi:hypothetical protein
MRWALACVAALTVITAIFSPSAARAAFGVSPGGCGTVLLAGSAWLGGHGVNVMSNGADEGLGTDCSSQRSYVNGVLAGDEWQCPELVNRLYLSRGWIKATWPGDAGQPMWNNTPGNLSKQANGTVSRLAPGDVVIINVFDNGTADGGHVLIVNDSSEISSGTVDLVSQNSGAPGDAEPHVSATISAGKVSVGGGGGGWTYQTIGVVHAPTTSQPPPPPPAHRTADDVNGDGKADVCMVTGVNGATTGSGKAEVHCLLGPNFQSRVDDASPWSYLNTNTNWILNQT